MNVKLDITVSCYSGEKKIKKQIRRSFLGKDFG